MKTTNFVVLGVLSVSMLLVFNNCSLSKAQRKQFAYHVFDSLENYLAEQVATKKDPIVVINPECQVCEEMFRWHWAIYGIAVADNTNHLQLRFVNLARKSGRCISIHGKLYPVVIVSVDDVFSAPTDSLSLSNYRNHGRASSGDFYWIAVDMDKSLFYTDFDTSVVRGLIRKKKK